MASNLLKRVISSIFIFLVFSLCFVASYNGYHAYFYLLISLVIVISSFEWFTISKLSLRMLPIAFFLIIIPNASLLYIYSMQHGLKVILWLILTVWSIDISAYVVGNLYGGRRLLPSVSPGKTWSGLIGGIVGAVTTSILVSFYNGLFRFLDAVIIGVIIAILAQTGDLVESFLKRVVHVKDSGFLIPGHGGVLDRVDGFIFSAPFIACFIRSFSSLY